MSARMRGGGLDILVGDLVEAGVFFDKVLVILSPGSDMVIK